MTQILIPTQSTGLTIDELLTAWAEATEAARLIPTTGGGAQLVGLGTYATYGGLVKIEHELRHSDPRGAWLLGATRGTSYVLPDDAGRVLARMSRTEGREIYSVTAVRAALGGTTTR
jgi:hypothetical protein